jgi:hypothetical protein
MRWSPQQWSAALSGQTGLQRLHAGSFTSGLSASAFNHVYMTPSLHETVLKLQHFVSSHILPLERVLSQPSPVSLPAFDSLREKARQNGLWNMFLQHTNTEYAPLCEVMGQVMPISSRFSACSTNISFICINHHFVVSSPLSLLKSSTAMRPTQVTWKFCITLDRKHRKICGCSRSWMCVCLTPGIILRPLK